MAVPLFDTGTPLARLREALHAKCADVLDGGRYILGAEVAACLCDGRRAAAGHYADAGLGDLVELPVPVDGCEPAWHLYAIRHPRTWPSR